MLTPEPNSIPTVLSDAIHTAPTKTFVETQPSSLPYLFSPSCPQVARQFGYFATKSAPVFAWQHFSCATITRKTIVILCYPMGYEYTHSHRSFQHWADQLAAIGCLVIRFDYSSTGDSPGRELPDDLLPIWLANITAIAEQARTAYPEHQLCLAGLRFGATLAYLAAQTLQADHLIVWEPIVQGRRYLRELQALAKFGVDSEETDADYTEFAGFLMSHATAKTLKTINLMDVPLLPSTRVLCIYREDGNHNNDFTNQLQVQGIQVEIQCQPGYEDMLAVPHQTLVPHQAIAATATWLAQGTRCFSESSQPLPMLSEINLENEIQEQGIWYDAIGTAATSTATTVQNDSLQHRLFAILTRPKTVNTKHPLVILLNSGAVHHVGPNRVYTHVARTIAEAGLLCVRLDIEGLGDSFKPDLIRENHPFQTTTQANLATAMDYLKHCRLAQDFIVGGICSGAHAAFHGGLSLGAPVIREVMLINPLVFYWQDGMTLDIPGDIQIAQDSKYYSSSMRDPKKWLKFLTGKASTASIVKFIKDRFVERARVILKHLRESVLNEHSPLSADLLRITHANIPISLLISASDPGLELVKSQARRTLKKGQSSGIIRVKTFAGANHTFSRLQHRNDLMAYMHKKFSDEYQ